MVTVAFHLKTEIFPIVLFFLFIQSDDIRGDGEHEESQEGDQRLGGTPGRLGGHRVTEQPGGWDCPREPLIYYSS